MKTVQKYEEIEQYILNLIAEQNLKPGNKIPTEIELCKQSGYSRMTINKALNHLADEEKEALLLLLLCTNKFNNSEVLQMICKALD